jgi:hypothetical protein
MSNPSTTHDHTGTDQAERGARWYRRPVPFGQLILVHLRIWRAQKGVVAGCLLALAAGLVGVAASMMTLPGTVTADAISTRFTGFSLTAFSLVWLAVGAIAAAAPFKSGWATVVLSVAPRRGRWLAACLVSFLLVTVTVTAAFAALAVLVTAVALAAKGHDPALAFALARPAGLLLAMVVLQAGIGFLLGAATRSVTAAIIIGYVVVPTAPQFAKIGSVDLGRWLNFNGALETLAAHTDGNALLPAVTALALWVAVPALVAWSRLRSSVG